MGFYYLLLLFVFRFILYAVLCDVVAFCLLLNVGKIVTVSPQYSLLLLLLFVTVVVCCCCCCRFVKTCKTREKQSQMEMIYHFTHFIYDCDLINFATWHKSQFPKCNYKCKCSSLCVYVRVCVCTVKLAKYFAAI